MPTDGPHPTPVHFFGLTAAAFDELVVGWGWPKFRAQQVRDWVYGKLVTDPARMTNLAPRDRETLAQRVAFTSAEVTRKQVSEDGTFKLLLTWPDAGGANAETVMIPDDDRRTACVSSQVGCPVGCTFCASGMNGVKGNLTAAQIVEQVFRLNEMLRDARSASPNAPDGRESRTVPVRALHPVLGEDDEADDDDEPTVRRTGSAVRLRLPQGRPGPPAHGARRLTTGTRPARPDRITNIVFMGMGEPLANYQNVMQAVRVLHDPKCLNLGARRITVSTVGVPPKMRELAKEDLPLNLAISLHAPTEYLRKQLIPWAEHFALDEILDAARFYFDRTGREITLEYILLAGVNDRPEHARALTQLCKTMRANVNLIRYNEVEGLPYARPKSQDVVTFQNVLRHNGVNAHVRKSRGRDIDAACGQLRRKQQEQQAAAVEPAQPANEQLVPLGTPPKD